MERDAYCQPVRTRRVARITCRVLGAAVVLLAWPISCGSPSRTTFRATEVWVDTGDVGVAWNTRTLGSSAAGGIPIVTPFFVPAPPPSPWIPRARRAGTATVVSVPLWMVGLALIGASTWLRDRPRPIRLACPKCGYSLRDLPGLRSGGNCPECGLAVQVVPDPPPRPRSA